MFNVEYSNFTQIAGIRAMMGYMEMGMNRIARGHRVE